MAKKIIIGVVVVAIIASMVVFNVLKSNDSEGMPKRKGKSYTVEAAAIEADTIKETIIVNGVVEEVDEGFIYFDTPITVKELKVKKGDIVKKGQQLMVLDYTSIERELEQLEISKEVQELQLQKLKSMTNTSDDSSLQIAIEIAQSNLNSAIKAKDDQQKNYDKNLELFNEGIITQTELDTYAKRVEDAESSIKSAELSLKRSKNDLTSFYTSNKNSKEGTNIDIAMQIKNIESSDLSIKAIKERLEKVKALEVSPMSGIITDLNLVEGTTTIVGQPAIRIIDNNHVKIVTHIKEYDLLGVKEGQEVVVTGDAIDQEQEVLGKVSYLEPMAKEVMLSGKAVTVVPAEIEVTSGNEYVKIGYKTECEITTNYKNDVPVLSYDMIQDDQGDKFVYVINEEDIVEKRMIELGIRSNFDVEVKSGVEVGEMVIINPSMAIKEGVVAIVEDAEEGE